MFKVEYVILLIEYIMLLLLLNLFVSITVIQ